MNPIIRENYNSNVIKILKLYRLNFQVPFAFHNTLQEQAPKGFGRFLTSSSNDVIFKLYLQYWPVNSRRISSRRFSLATTGNTSVVRRLVPSLREWGSQEDETCLAGARQSRWFLVISWIPPAVSITCFWRDRDNRRDEGDEIKFTIDQSEKG